nr:uncharacterized protein LOC120976322 [Aegilops tauschii subsp. strangulata]
MEFRSHALAAAGAVRPQCFGCLLPPQPPPPRPRLLCPLSRLSPRLLRPPPASPWTPTAASTPRGTRCTSSPAAAPHATHSSPSTRSTATPFRYALLPEDIHTVCTKLGFRSPSSSPPAINQFARMRHEEIGYRPGRRIGGRKMQKIARQYMFSCMFES